MRSRTSGPPSVPPNWLRRYVRLRLGSTLKEVPRVQRLVAEELERVRRETSFVPDFGRQVDHAAVEAAELGRRAVALDLELLDRVDDRKERDLARLGLQHRDAVEEVLVRARPAAVDARQLRVRRQRDAGRERRERDEGAAVQRQLRRPARCSTTVPEAGGLGAEHRRVGRDCHLLADVADGELEVEARLLAGRRP